MAHRNAALAQTAEPVPGQRLADQSHIPPGGEHAVIVDCDARTFLAPVLERIQPVISQSGHVLRLRGKEAEHAALLVEMALHSPPLSHHAP